MVDPVTAEQTARRIVALLAHELEREPGDALALNEFLGTWKANGHAVSELREGLDFATDQGWIEVTDNGARFALTRAGLDEA